MSSKESKKKKQSKDGGARAANSGAARSAAGGSEHATETTANSAPSSAPASSATPSPAASQHTAAAAKPVAPAPSASSSRASTSGASTSGASTSGASTSGASISGASVPLASDLGFVPASGQPANAPVNKGLAITLLALLLGGIGVSTYLTRAHLEMVYGDGSFKAVCDFGSGFSCTDVITSQYATLFGVLPWSVLAIPAYSVMFMLGLRGVTQQDRKSLGLLSLMGAVSVALSVVLFYISSMLIGAWCPFCIVMYAVNLSALVLPRFIMRETFSDGLRYGFKSLGDRRTVALSAANLLFVGSLAYGGYSATKSAMLEQTTAAVVGRSNASGGAASSSATGAGAAAGTGAGTGAAPVAPRNPDARRDVPIDASVPFEGPSDARVTIVAYEDFQCGFCKRLSSNFAQLTEKYPKDVRIGYRHFPMHQACNDAGIPRSMHPDACRSAIASECANQQGKFWEMHDILFKNQRNLGGEDISQYARDIGLDTAAFTSCQSDPRTVEKIKEDSRTGKTLGVSGTPTFFLNGRQFSGAQPIEVLSALVDAELSGKEITMAELRDVQPLPDITGTVTGPEMTALTGPDGPFEMDTFEASIENGKAVSKPGKQVANNVTWFDADKACRAAGKRLCTEGEWLTACSGALALDANGNADVSDDPLKGTTYPYGEDYKAGVCNDQVVPPKDASPNSPPPTPPLITGTHPQCKSKNGIFDLTGNVREWVGVVAPRSAYFGGAFYSRDDAACISRAESFGPFARQEALGFRCCRGGNPKDRITHPGRQVGETLKPFSGVAPDGSKISSDLLKGHVALVSFWASWCGPCREELPAYSRIYPELEKKGFRIIAINVDQDAEKGRQFLEKNPLSFPVLMDTDNSILSSFDTKAMPTAFLVNAKGQIMLRRTGFEKGDEKRLQKTVEKMLADPNAGP